MSKLSFYVLKNKLTGNYVINDELGEGAFKDACLFRDLHSAKMAIIEVEEAHKQETERAKCFFAIAIPPPPLKLTAVLYRVKEDAK